jgi:hypothetical protein
MLSQPLLASSQRPAYIDQRRRRTKMGHRPRGPHISQISRIMHQQLCNDVKSQQIHHLRIRGRDDLRQRSCERECWSTLINTRLHTWMIRDVNVDLPGKFSISA